MIEAQLAIDGPAPVERRLDAACALVHTLLARTILDGPAEQAEALTLFAELPLPAAVFGAGPAPRLANGAWHALLGVLDRAFPRAHVDEVLRTGARRHLSELALGGGAAYLAATLRPIRGGGGATTGVIVVCASITDEVVARELEASAGALVWGGPVAGGTDYANGAWTAYTRGLRPWAPSDAWLDAIHDDDRPSCAQAFEAADRGRATEAEARVRRTDGAYRWHRIRFAIARASRWYAVATEIHEARAEAEHAEELARERAARAAAEQINRLKDQFLATVSHELRSPVTTMLLWERVLRDEATDVALRAQALEAVHESALTEARLVDDLLDVYRGISGKLRVDLRPLDIERVVREALEAMAPAALARQIAILRGGAAVAAAVLGDAIRLRQVLDNLLSNALKFTEPGGRVSVTAARLDRWIAIEIEDSGRGIAPEALPRLFEPFSQIDAPLTRVNGGLGLGLAIAKQLVALHGGELTAASAGLGRGSTFTLRLPIAEETAAGSPVAESARTLTLDGIRVLVIDDDQHVRAALALLFDRLGAVVDTAESAEAARAQIARHPPEALVCDLAMPGEDGLMFIQRLRSSPTATRDIPAIAVTAQAREMDAERARAAGFDLHAPKPIDFECLVERIGELVAARRARASGDRR